MALNHAVIVFAQNSEKGKVKPAIASQLDNDTAVAAYKYLLQHTAEVCLDTHCHRFVFYSDYIHINDVFDDRCFTKCRQEGADLGEQMSHAFQRVFGLHHTKVCLVRSDCYQLEAAHINQAFEVLDNYDVAIGPTTDGGFYLLAMKSPHPILLEGIHWGTASVFDQTLNAIKAAGLSHNLLSSLNDVDTIDDLNETDILDRLAEDEPATDDPGIV